MKTTRQLLVAALLLAPLACDVICAAPHYWIEPQTPQGLQKLFKHTGEALPLVSAHRGGPQKQFPENCIATFENTLRHTYAIMEVDPRYTRDGTIVLHHDARLERTTTGSGLVADHSLKELKQLRLKDRDGNATEFQIPTLDEALEWVRGKTILVLDQKDVPVSARVHKIEEHKAEAFTIVIVYSFKEARECYELNKNIMMEVMIPNCEKAAAFEKTGVPWRNVVAFVGHTPSADPRLYDVLHGKGVICFVGSSQTLDQRLKGGKVRDIKDCENDYRALLTSGADIIETDLPCEVGQFFYTTNTIPESKKQFFRKMDEGRHQ